MFEVKNMTTSYGNETVLKDISFQVNKNSIVGIIGPNGAGKSTLIKSILNLVKKDTGNVFLNDEEIINNHNFSYIPQKSEINLDFPLTVIEIVLMGLYPSKGLFKRFNKEDIKKAEQVLESVDMHEYKHRQIGQLSGGQQQRVFLARALIQDSDILFLDEPFLGVDIKTEQLIVKILKDLKEQNKLIFIVHHDLTKVKQYFDDLIILNRDLIASGKVEDVFTEENMFKAYNLPLEIEVN